jgi:hypothetical protein
VPDTDLHVGVVYSGLSSVRATSGHALVKGWVVQAAALLYIVGAPMLSECIR